MGRIAGSIRDAATGEKVQARVQVLDPAGVPAGPDGALWKVGPGEPFFYSDGEFSIETTRGYYRVLVERGTEYRPWQTTVHVGKSEIAPLDIALDRWSDLPVRGWHPGNTHIHYDENETRPDERLGYDSRVEDLRMTAVSILKRWDLEYATNKYAPGVMNEYTDTHHYVQCGEETRHNSNQSHEIGYGHVMLLNIRNVVDPLSRGLLVDRFEPDYPPLTYACDDARRQGGLVIWCHNGQGMEAPVAAALGKLHAFNLFDPHWVDVEYDIYYQMLNCGFRMPASTGSDWFVSSANRVYSQSGNPFSYEQWLQAVKDGKTFITNGPGVFMSVVGCEPGETVQCNPGEKLNVHMNWDSHYGIHRAEIVTNGKVIASRDFPSGSTHGHLSVAVPVESDGWIAARLGSSSRDSFNQPIWAHTSPVYVDTGGVRGEHTRVAASKFADGIDKSLEWVKTKGKFYNDSQRAEIVTLFREGQEIYKGLAK